MLGFEPFCLDLGHIAWIWAIWQNMGQNRPQRRRSPEDGAGGTDGWMDGRTDSPCSVFVIFVCMYVRPSPPPHPQGFVSFGAYSDPNSAK